MATPMNTHHKVLTLCYDGGGWTFPYLAGVTKRIQENERRKNTKIKYIGISSGACVALAAAIDIPMETLVAHAEEWAKYCKVCPLLTVTAVRSITKTLLSKSNVKTIDDLNRKNNFALCVSKRKKMSF